MPEPRPRRRALFVSALLAAGILAASYAPAIAHTLWFAVAAASALAAWCTRGRAAVVFLSLSAFATGGGCFALRVYAIPADHVARMLGDDPRLIAVEGMVISTPRRITTREGRLGSFFPATPRTSFDLQVDHIDQSTGDTARAHGILWVGVDGDAPTYAVGERIHVLGMARAIPPPMNPGEHDRRRWARARNVAGVIDVDAAGAIQPARSPPSRASAIESCLRRIVERLRTNAHAWLATPAHHDDDRAPRALLRALLLGENDRELAELNEAFTRLGLSHILSISGLNLVVLAGAVIYALRFLGDRPRLEALLAASIILLYLLVIPARSPVQRAAFMVLTLLAAETAGRRYDRLTILGWAAALILIIQPMELFSPGFQLSFGVVAALLTLTDSVRGKLFGRRPEPDTLGVFRRTLEQAKEAAAASIVAWAVASPLIAYHIGIFSPLGAIATLALMPLVSLIMGLGYVTLIVAIALPAAGHWIEPALTTASSLLARLVLLIDAAPWTVVHLPAVSLAWTVLATVAAVWWMWPVEIEGFSRRATRARWLCTALAAAWLALTILAPRLIASDAARLDTLYVGDGACHLLRVPNEQWGTDAILYDCGSLRLNIGERTIPAALRALGARRVRTIILSHPNIDHYAALLDLLQPLGTRRVIVGEAFIAAAAANPGGPVAFTLNELHRRGVEVITAAEGDSITLGRARLEFLSPPRGSTWRHDNDASLVIRVDVPINAAPASHRTILFTGDIQREAIIALRERHPDLNADILEAPHHGSHNDAAEDFIPSLNPAFIVQSTGPRRAADTRWNDLKPSLHWRTTATDGAVSYVIDTNGAITSRAWRRE